MVFSACRIWTLFTCYLHMYMSSTHYLGICILCAHYLQWSLIYSFLTDNADVIHLSSLVLFIYPIMYNLVSAHCLHRCTLSMSFACNECRLSSRDTMRWCRHSNHTLWKEICLNFFAFTLSGVSACTIARAQATWWNFHGLSFCKIMISYK